MNVLVLMGIIFGGMGVFFLLLAVPFLSREKKLLSACTEQAEGVVVGHEIHGQDSGRTISPTVEFTAGGQTYHAYRHYKGVVRTKKQSLDPDKIMGQQDSLYVSEKDVLHINTKGVVRKLADMAEEKWPIGMQMTVLYNPEKPKQAFVEKVVSSAKTVGIVFLCVGLGFAVPGVICLILGLL